MASKLESFNARGNRQKEAVVLPTAEELVEQERDAWQRFFGKEIDVPNPPQELLHTLAKAKEQGINVFEPHYLPPVEFKQNSRFPGWKIKPEKWYWENLRAKDSSKLGGFWILIDGSPKPEYDDGRQLYPDDPFGKLLEDLENEGKMTGSGPYHLPRTSRFGIKLDERETQFYRALADLLSVDANKVRVPKAIEFNVIGNLHHPQWGETTISEWFEERGFQGGDSRRGGLAYVAQLLPDIRGDSYGFRPLIEFPQK